MEKLFGFLLLFLLLLVFVSAADNLCLDDVGWDVSVVHSPGSPAECPSIPNSPNNVNDGNQNTVSMGCRMNDNYDYPVEITFPSVVPLITRVSYNYSSSMAYKSYPSVPGVYSKVELVSEGAWVEAVGCVVLYEGNSVIPYIGGINNPRSREECVGVWNNVEKIRLTLSAQYGCCPSDPGPFAGYVFLEEVGAYDDVSAVCVPDCSGKDCGTDGCSGSCGSCAGGFTCSSGSCVPVALPPPVGSDIIMKLSSSDNAHGALWNDGVYTEEILYSSIFGGVYSGDLTTVHDCIVGNEVVGISGLTNAHAEDPSLDNYANNVCYGDLVCEADSSFGDSCFNGGEIVVRLASVTNSHLSDSFGSYPVKICCVSGGGSVVVPPVGTYWADANGKEITDSHLGATVKMIYTNAGGVYDFEIYEDDDFLFGGVDDDIRVGAEAIEGVLDENGNLVAEWTITADDLNNADDLIGTELFDGFYFIVNGEVSKNLTISTTYYDDPMVVKIVSPNCADFFDQGNIVKINITADDPDDVIYGDLLIGDDEYSFTNGVMVFNYTFDVAGNIQIIANSVNSRRVRQRDISNVMIIDTMKNDVYVAACITKPEDFFNFGTGSVRFEAGATHGINFSLPSNYEMIPKKDLNFYWTFSDGRVNHNVDGANSLSYSFFSNYTSAGDNWAILDVDIKGYL